MDSGIVRRASVGNGSVNRLELLDKLLGIEQDDVVREDALLEGGNTMAGLDADVDLEKFSTSIEEYSSIVEESISLLTPLFQYIQDFQTNLTQLSKEMEFLQVRLQKLQQNIEFNSKIDIKLTPILNDLLIPVKTVQLLSQNDGDIGKEWIEQLNILFEKKEILSIYHDKNINQVSINELNEIIHILEVFCELNIKKCLIKHIKFLRNPNVSNIKIQKKLLKIKEIIKFLGEKNPSLLQDFKHAYILTMRWYYHFNFVKYILSLEGLKMHEYNEFSTKLDNSNTMNGYLINLPKRVECLDEDSGFSILAQIAESQTLIKFNIEDLFSFLNQALIDNLSIESQFLNNFFHIDDNESINKIFKPIFNLCSNFTNYLVDETKDYVGILIIIRKIQKFEYLNQKRCLSELYSNYLNLQLIKLWPLFQNNIDELCKCVNVSITSSSLIKHILQQSNNRLVPLQITQSFANLMTILIKLSSTNEPLNASIERLSNVFERGLVQLSKAVKEGDTTLLYVNTELVAAVLGDSDNTIGEHYGKLRDSYK